MREDRPSSDSAAESGGITIVGAGLAGLSTAEELRERGYDGPITLIGAEEQHPYDRPPLSKEYLTSPEAARLQLRDENELAKLELRLRLGRRAVGLDAARRTVTLDDGTAIGYTGLVIATGARARQPGTHLAGLHTLRTVADAAALRDALEHTDRVVVVGAGFIGSEIAASARGLGCAVTLIEAAPTPLATAIDPRLGATFAEIHRQQGVDLRLGIEVTGYGGTDRVERVWLNDGSSVAASVVVAGLGVELGTDWLAGSGARLAEGPPGGVHCDAYCATNLAEVYAVGDLANWPHPRYGRLRLEHWTNAREQAAVVAHNLLCAPEERQTYAPVPYFWSDQYGMKIQLLGQASPAEQLAVVSGSQQERKFVAFLGRGGMLTGILGLRSTPKVMRYRRLLTEPTSWADALAAAGQ